MVTPLSVLPCFLFLFLFLLNSLYAFSHRRPNTDSQTPSEGGKTTGVHPMTADSQVLSTDPAVTDGRDMAVACEHGLN